MYTNTPYVQYSDSSGTDGGSFSSISSPQTNPNSPDNTEVHSLKRPCEDNSEQPDIKKVHLDNKLNPDNTQS